MDLKLTYFGDANRKYVKYETRGPKVDTPGKNGAMRVSVKKIGLTILCVYIAFTCYTTYTVLQGRYAKDGGGTVKSPYLRGFKVEDDASWNPWGEEFVNEQQQKIDNVNHDNPQKYFGGMRETKDSSREYNVEIWGKAAIGSYLWEHIIAGSLEDKMVGIWSYGFKQIENLKLTFRTGPGLVPEKAPRETENLVLVLNGREPAKVEFAKTWLDSLAQLQFLKNVAVLLLGNEQCNNDWIKKYMSPNGGPVKFVFIVYDAPEVDDWNFYQWPLGVATYRQFPFVPSESVNTKSKRKYTCNFLGTMYPNSSREILRNTLKQHNMERECYIKMRDRWESLETDKSRVEYIHALENSDLTLNPVGKNTECYRIYESISLGSTPVVEDIVTPGNCGKSNFSHNSPLRLLKNQNAPVVFIKNWKDLPEVIEKYKQFSTEELAQKRKDIVDWYEKFLHKMRNRFIQIIQRRFFNLS